MIEAGALDQQDVNALAERLGVGERQLRRLFREHLGASPLGVAQTRRVLLAKQLIHQTTMPMAEVAMASGFGSIRRFNETFQQLYKRPPAALRRGKTGTAGGPVKLKLAFRAPYDWEDILAFLRSRAIPGVESVSETRYARTIAVGDEKGWIAIERGTGNSLDATIHFKKLTALPSIVARIRRVFDLAADPLKIGAQLSEDEMLASLIRLRPGLRVPGAWDGFELGSRAILGQQITVAAATALAGKMVRTYGEPLAADESRDSGLTHLFPSPERLVDLDSLAMGMPRARASALRGLAAAVMADPQILSPGRDLDEAIKKLCALPGIGEWTAHYIAMRALREPDAFPPADIGLLRALTDSAGRRPTPAELLTRAEQWRPWRAYAALHLWAADSVVVKEPQDKKYDKHAA
jgi:AraC family transcriptional regulator, regulatory protein of adaptative response / DNA-3-methyladenine glycosylase II